MSCLLTATFSWIDPVPDPGPCHQRIDRRLDGTAYSMARRRTGIELPETLHWQRRHSRSRRGSSSRGCHGIKVWIGLYSTQMNPKGISKKQQSYLGPQDSFQLRPG
ncbi:hypothetical protein MLD38_003458 [Melastoma candidum]|uniref:Uncharacterized protein n=1 Tax=Melastoma candidum TaxID=119954 RepID=A0ACB9S5T7_9MYRT|nr:hypothetical protein MLD38_003458 [Melastoma candidum]